MCIRDRRWFEDGLSYCNAVLPHALLFCGQAMPNQDMSDAGFESLLWLAELQRSTPGGGHFVPIGSNGFYPVSYTHLDVYKRQPALRPV